MFARSKMRHFGFSIGCVVCLAIFAVAGCKPTPRYQMVGEPNADQPPSTPTPEPDPRGDAGRRASGSEETGGEHPARGYFGYRFRPVGKLLRSGTGFFVSDVGRIITTWHTVEGALNGVAKTADGGIYNIAGILASSAPLDLAILSAEVKKVPFLILSKTSKPGPGTSVAAIGSALAGNAGNPVEGTIASGESNESEDELKVTASVPGHDAWCTGCRSRRGSGWRCHRAERKGRGR